MLCICWKMIVYCIIDSFILAIPLSNTSQNSNFKRTSRPKARDGHRYPCPAERFVYGSLLGKQGFGPEGGRSPVEHRGNLYVHTSVHTYFCLSVLLFIHQHGPLMLDKVLFLLAWTPQVEILAVYQLKLPAFIPFLCRGYPRSPRGQITPHRW